MSVKQRRYKLLSDFKKVSSFLENNYDEVTLNSYLLKQFFEYAHTHPMFKHQFTHRFGIWEDNDEIVGITCYEMGLGECFISIKKSYDYLLQEMLENAEKQLSIPSKNNTKLDVWVTSEEDGKIELLKKNGYKKEYTEPITIFSYDKKFINRQLPEGYSIITLEEENNLNKIHECLWKGFNHGENPDEDPDGIDGRLLMQSGPNFRSDLTTIIKAPNGDYACYAGMWFDKNNSYAYLEPLATVPEYRKKGLATIAITEGMEKTKKLGAKYCFGGVSEFYKSIGFETICFREKWKKLL